MTDEQIDRRRDAFLSARNDALADYGSEPAPELFREMHTAFAVGLAGYANDEPVSITIHSDTVATVRCGRKRDRAEVLF